MDLDNCSLGDAGIKNLMRNISTHSFITDPHSGVNTLLDLGRNEIHEEGASHIAEVLNNTSIVSELWLRDNPIGDKGLQTVFSSLKKNNTLKVLGVSYCDMTDAGVPSLAEAMNINTTLETLYIYGNDKITNNGLICLVDVLSRSSRLVELRIPYHFNVDRVMRTINEARERNGLEAILVQGKCAHYTLDPYHCNCTHARYLHPHIRGIDTCVTQICNDVITLPFTLVISCNATTD